MQTNVSESREKIIIIRLDKEHSLTYKCAGRVGPLTVLLKTRHLDVSSCRCRFLIWFFYFLIWCTDPAKIGNFQPEYIVVVVQQSVTLTCEAEGNPPPTYTWTPCVPEQVCNKNILHISQAVNDTNYTCKVANSRGLDSKAANVCKSHRHCSHASNSCIFIHIPTWHFDWVFRVELGVNLSCYKSPNNSSSLSHG